MIDLMELAKPKPPIQLLFNPNVLKLKAYFSDKDYLLRLVDEAIGSGLLTRQEWHELTRRYDRLSFRMLAGIFEQLVRQRVKKADHDYYWELKNFETNRDSIMNSILNASTQKKNGDRRGKGV